MTFFLIVPSVIIVCVFLIHGVFNRLGLRIHYGALITCALLSVAADAGAAVLSPAPDKFYFLRLGGFIFSSALIGTFINYLFTRKEIQEQEKFSEEVQAAYHEQVEPIKKVDLVKKQKPKKKVDLVKKSKPTNKVLPKKNLDLQKKSDTDKISEIKTTATKTEIKPIEKSEPKKILMPEEISVSVQKIEPKKISVPVKKSEPEKVEPAEIPSEINFSKSAETLDELLDLAYAEKSQGHVWQAIAAYKKALEKYRSDSYAPFVAIDLGNIYKEQAMYAKAIKVFEDVLELPAVKRNFSTNEEFKKNIIYLKAVQSVLLRHQALKTPFSKISKIYLQEIESEFQAANIGG